MRKTLITVSLVALVIAGCDRKAEGQTVAVVNGDEITSAELNAELGRLNATGMVDKDKARAQVLQALVDRRLLAQQAKSDGLDKSPEFLNKQRRATEDLLIQMLASRQLNTAQLPSPDAIASFQATHPEMFAKREIWNLDQLFYPTPTDAAALKRIADAHSMDALVAALTQSGIAFNRGKNKINTAIVPHDLYVRLSALPAGEPFLVPAGSRSVANVIVSREPSPPTADEARAFAVQAMRQADGQKFMEARLKSLHSSAKIDYKPGFAPKP
ncbi:MAG: SurA N-terminal domain-containing protein [Sphingomicrobium sp.]|nr:SurA N-terminal domain-containing protein [Sphingomonadales bacterium]